MRVTVPKIIIGRLKYHKREKNIAINKSSSEDEINLSGGKLQLYGMVKWLGYLVFTQKARVRFPVPEIFLVPLEYHMS